MTKINLFFYGCSGAGKSTAIKYLIKKYKDCYLNISYTTRNKREGEIDGNDYYFISKDDFREKIRNGFFIEYAEFKGNLYGTTLNDHVNKNIRIFDLETKGILFYKEYFKSNRNEAIFIYLSATREIVESRLKLRNLDEIEFNRRAGTFLEAQKFAKTFCFDFLIDTGNDIKENQAELDFIIENLI